MMNTLKITRILVVSGACCLLMLLAGCGTKTAPPGALFSEKGSYQSPSGELTVQIKNGSAGQLRYRFTFKSGKDTEYNEFPATKEWFMCWDNRDRLWVHVDGGPTCYWYPTGINQVGQHAIGAKLEASDLAIVPKEFKDKLPAGMKPPEKPARRK